jgi:hypothetical protein
MNDPASARTLVFARMILDPDDGGDIFLEDVGSYTDYTMPYPSRRQLS